MAIKKQPATTRRRKPRPVVLTWPHPDIPDGDLRADRLNRWAPNGTHHDACVGFARAVAWLSGHGGQKLLATARAALRHANRLATDGIPLTAEQALLPIQVEHTAATVFRPGASATGTAHAGALRAAARTIHPSGWTTTTPGAGRKPPAAPYTPDEAAALLDAAMNVRSKRRRRELAAFVALTCGAGLTGTEVSRLTWADVTPKDTGATVSVAGRRVPVLSAFAAALMGAAVGQDPGAGILTNTTDNGVWLLHDYARTHGMPDWDVWRATNTWRVHQLSRVPLPVLARGANLSPAHLAGLLAYCPAPDDTSLALLGDEPKGEGGAE